MKNLFDVNVAVQPKLNSLEYTLTVTANFKDDILVVCQDLLLTINQLLAELPKIASAGLLVVVPDSNKIIFKGTAENKADFERNSARQIAHLKRCFGMLGLEFHKVEPSKKSELTDEEKEEFAHLFLMLAILGHDHA